MRTGSGVARAVAALLVAGWCGGATAETSDPSFGLWLIEKGTAIVEIGPCRARPDRACGYIVWLKNPRKAALPKTDDNNPDPALRGRPLCGLALLDGFRRAGIGQWERGRIYDPSRGQLYGAEMRVAKDGLAVRGFVGFAALGRTQTWTRVADARGGC